ncbi:MAG: alpha/beta fold hydrolase [Polyangiaceae bacterium]|jgi:predicted alpha/beta hydrolase
MRHEAGAPARTAVASSGRGERGAPRVEEIEVRTRDGWSLRTDVHEPLDAPVGVAVLAHAFMARRTEFDRPRDSGFAPFLVGLGWRVVAFDFRAHGDSGPLAHQGGDYGYDDLVTRDIPAVCAFARSRARSRLPLVVVGHSLGGHVALAAQGTGAIDVDAVVGFGASPWLPELEPSRSRWVVKRAILAATLGVTRRVGRLPARALGRGSDDEPRACVEDFSRFARTGAWTSADGRVDYLASLANVRVPVLSVVSEGDRLECVPACAERLLARTGGPKDIVRIERRDDGSRPPGHMGLVTSGRVRRAWGDVERWMRQAG